MGYRHEIEIPKQFGTITISDRELTRVAKAMSEVSSDE